MIPHEPPMLGELVRWSHGANVLIGLASGYDPATRTVVLLTDVLHDLSFRVPVTECCLAEGPAGQPRSTAHADGFLAGLHEARAAIAIVAAELAMSDDVVRCAGASRAYEAVDDLIVALDA